MTIQRTKAWLAAFTTVPSVFTVLLWVANVLSTSHLMAQNYSPEHPKVQAMVDRAGNYLSQSKTQENFEGGKTALVGYTMLKITGDPEHPKVRAGIAAALEMTRRLAVARVADESKVMYTISVAALLLAEADQARYRPELEQILAYLVASQKANGGFGYPGRPLGDTSQVQYAMLAFWMMHKIGLDVPTQVIEGAVRYLIATRDPSGGWGYQGNIVNGVPVRPTDVTKSLATAGACSVLIGGDILGFYREMKRTDEADGIPEAFVRTDLIAKRRAERKNITLSRSDIDPSIELAQRYQDSHNFTQGDWYYYWRYSQERYESFIEVMQAKQNKSPAWYNQGVDELASFQEADGSWGAMKKKDFYSEDVCTCFAVLFLIRSTQKAIGKLNEGLLGGGYGLPDDVSSIRRVGDRIINDAEASVENLLSMMESNAGGNVEVGLLPENLQLSKDPKEKKEQVARLSRLLVSRDYKSRQLAAKLLGRSEDLDQAPELIYALLDADPAVPMIAEESLRLLSRKLTAGDLKYNPKLEQKQAAHKFWKAWYLGLRPDYVFVDP
jgi:hypothetical protein